MYKYLHVDNSLKELSWFRHEICTKPKSITSFCSVFTRFKYIYKGNAMVTVKGVGGGKWFRRGGYLQDTMWCVNHKIIGNSDLCEDGKASFTSGVERRKYVLIFMWLVEIVNRYKVALHLILVDELLQSVDKLLS